ncbi:STAM-binding protein-like [Ostrea edulis]|uniref:STAM-binding protein-like n=1 Tax=Ostrea edulis TaxID=37623 RepID=UPI0024AFCFC0|nr:STAM-binding protein-like [Ostrea edulis]XP_056017814.1 STAM-binding protein-like [Ostrea edulis]
MAQIAIRDASLTAHIRDPGARVRELCNYACKVEIDPQIPPRRYLRSGHEVLRMAKVYQDEKNYEQAFILYTKFISLFVEKLPKHPDYKMAPVDDVSAIKKKVKLVFPIAEELKTILKKRYKDIEKKRLEEERIQQEQLEREQERQRQEEAARQQEEEARQIQARSVAEAKWLDEQEHKLQELKEKELLKNIDQDSESNEKVVKDNDTSGLNNQRPSATAGSLTYIHNDLGERPVEKNLMKDSQYPNIPDRELKKNLVISDYSTPTINGSPDIDRSTKPDHFTSTGFSGLREVVIPSDLMRKFLVIAEHNTLRNIETCGILAGKLVHNSFHITHVLIPKQSGTTDTCVAEDEEDLFLYQDPRDLITLGWIHTHPTQTAFLSSVDMHNQYGYQAMLPEAIAIVCAPKYQETGIFTLTSERGLPEIGKCRERGFHQHTKVPPLFDSCSHIRLVDTERIEMADLRRK